MIKLTLWILLLFIGCYGCLCLFLFLRQRSILYYPHPPVATEEADAFWLESENQRIKIWHVDNGPGPALIYFGGNAEDVSGNLPFFKTSVPSYSLYLMNYRGYGGSSGFPSETSLYADSLALYEQVSKHHNQVVVMGRSLGTGMAVYCASQKKVSAVILVTPFSSMTALASSYYPFMPVGPLLKDRYDSQQYAQNITAPVLTLTAENDEIIPRRISNRLIASFDAGITENVIIEQTGHNNIEQSTAYRSHLEYFLNRHIEMEKINQ